MSDYFVHRIGATLWPTIIALAVLEGLVLHVWRFYRERGAQSLLGILICKMIWLLSLAAASMDDRTAPHIFWLDVAAVTTGILSYFTFNFMAEEWGLGRNIRRVADGINLVAFVLCTAAVLTDPWSHAYWRLTVIDGHVAQHGAGPLLMESQALIVLLNLGCFAFTTLWAICERGLRRRQAIAILCGALLSWIGFVLARQTAVMVPASLPIFFTFSAMPMTWAFTRWRMLGLLPLAQETVLNNQGDGLLILDQSDRIVELNQAAQELFPALNLVAGDPFRKAINDWLALERLTEDKKECAFDVGRSLVGAPPLLFQVEQTVLRNPMGYSLGRVLTFTDVTEERSEQARNLEQHKTVSMLEERRRLGREFHDDGQIWFYLGSQAKTMDYLLEVKNAERAREHLRRMTSVIEEKTFGMRESILGLQSELNENHGLPEALEEQLDWYRNHCEMEARLFMNTAWEPECAPLPAQAQLLRIAQEALANVRKHAQASAVRIELHLDDGRLLLGVIDNGRGFDPELSGRAMGHFGLKTMRERAQSIGAQLHLDAAPGAGSRITVELPLLQS